MKRKPLFVSVIWMYEGKDRTERLRMIEGLDYPAFEIVESFAARSPKADICLFWADDGKPVSSDFIRRMVDPLTSQTSRQGLHLWSGNALAVPAAMMPMLAAAGEGEIRFTSQSFLRSMLPFLEPVAGEGRIRVALSSVERLAPLTTDPMGLVS